MWKKVSSQEITVVDDQSNLLNDMMEEKVPLSERKWFKVLFVVSLIIGGLVLVFGWMILAFLILFILFAGSIMGGAWKEAGKDSKL